MAVPPAPEPIATPPQNPGQHSFPGLRTTKRGKVYDNVRTHILSATTASPGGRLPSTRALAKSLGASVFTVHRAIQALESEGYLETRQGSGTFITSCHRPITIADTVTICMDSRGHLWPELISLMMESLARRDVLGTLVSPDSATGGSNLFKRLARSESSTIILQAGGGFPFELFDLPGMDRKNIIAVVSWTSRKRPANLHRILHNREVGASLVAQHLRSRGHTRVLIVGTDTQLAQLEADNPCDLCPASPFRNLWEGQGGRWWKQESEPIPGGQIMKLDPARFLAHFDGPEPPTAVFGLRDHEAWLAQGLLLRHRPELYARVEIIGYGNTPWSQSGQPPFSTVDFNFDGIVAETMKAVDLLRTASVEEPISQLVLPRLVLR